jgi:hypothetical protein
MKSNHNQALVEEVIIAIDKMLLSSDKIFEEKKYANYRYANNLFEIEYEPAKNQLRQALLMLLSDKTKSISNQE